MEEQNIVINFDFIKENMHNMTVGDLRKLIGYDKN